MTDENITQQQSAQQPTQPQEQPKEFLEPEITKEQLVPIEVGGMGDLSEFEGNRVEIEDWKIITVNTGYDENGNWTEGLKRPVQKIQVYTKPILGPENKPVTYVDKNGETQPLRATELFNIKRKTNEAGWSKHERSNAQKFFKKLKINNFNEAKGKFVTLTQRGDWLGFAYK